MKLFIEIEKSGYKQDRIPVICDKYDLLNIEMVLLHGTMSLFSLKNDPANKVKQ